MSTHVCAVPAASVVAESVVALTLCADFLEKFGEDNMDDVRSALLRYLMRTPLTTEEGSS